MTTSYDKLCQELDGLFTPPKPRKRRKSKFALDQEVDRGNYIAYRDAALRLQENNDCAVRAVAEVCDVTYEAARSALARFGRKPGEGTTTWTIHDAIDSLGFQVIRGSAKSEVKLLEVCKNYKVKNITTRQVSMFAEHFGKTRKWDDYSGVLLYTSGHVAAYRNGAVHDYGAARALRVYSLYYVKVKA